MVQLMPCNSVACVMKPKLAYPETTVLQTFCDTILLMEELHLVQWCIVTKLLVTSFCYLASQARFLKLAAIYQFSFRFYSHVIVNQHSSINLPISISPIFFLRSWHSDTQWHLLLLALGAGLANAFSSSGPEVVPWWLVTCNSWKCLFFAAKRWAMKKTPVV